MNTRRSKQGTETRSYGFHLFSIFLGIAVAGAGGVYYGYLKNRQIQVSREVDAAERRIEEHRLDIRTCGMRMDQLLNRFAIRKQLESSGSPLRPIPFSVIEEIDQTPPQERAVARITNLTE